MESPEDRVAILEAELRARDEHLARLEPLIVPVEMMRSYVHEARTCISALGVSIDRLFTTRDHDRSDHDARDHVIKGYERVRRLHDEMADVLFRRPHATILLATCINEVARAATPASVRTEITADAANARLPAEMRLALHHLVRNAIESYASNDHREAIVRAAIEHGRAIVAVIDHGRGIPAPVLPQVWSISYTRKNRPGMGLALVKHLVESWNGTVSIASTTGQGTTVTLSLPLHYEEHPMDR